MSRNSTDTEKETWKTWVLVTLFGAILLTPASFGAWFMHEAGLPIGVTVLLVGLTLPSLLLPTLPKRRRIAILKAGWPARVAFGVPGITIGMLMLQFGILDMGRVSFIGTTAIMTFGGLITFLGGLLLVPNLTETHSTKDN